MPDAKTSTPETRVAAFFTTKTKRNGTVLRLVRPKDDPLSLKAIGKRSGLNAVTLSRMRKQGFATHAADVIALAKVLEVEPAAVYAGLRKRAVAHLQALERGERS